MNDSDALSRFANSHIAAIEAVESEGTCLVGPNHDAPAIRGHVIPKNRLELIAERCDRHEMGVRTFTMGLGKLRARAVEKVPPVQDGPDVECVNIGNERMTSPFACKPHDGELFAPVDGPGLDRSNPEHCALVSYRTLLYIQREALTYTSALGRIQHCAEFRALGPEVGRSMLERRNEARAHANLAHKAQSELRRDLQAQSGNPRESAFAHRSMHVLDSPRVAFAGALLRGGNAGWTERERAAAPKLTASVREPASFVLTCYPDEGGHNVVASCPSRVAELLPVVIPAFDETRSDREAVLSATALDAAEHIMIAPSVWQAYGRDRQVRMWRRLTSQGDPPLDAIADPVSEPLNLFV